MWRFIGQLTLLTLVIMPSTLLAQSTIQVGETRVGSLSQGDKRLPLDGSLYDRYVFEGQAGQRIKIELTSTSFEPYLALMDRDGTELISSSADADTRTARIEITLSYTGRYHIRVNSLHKDGTGRYTLKIQ